MNKIFFLLLLFTISSTVSFAQEPYLHWVRELKGNNYNSVSRIITDANNNVYMLGKFTGNLDLNAGSLDTSIQATGANDYYFVKYDRFGNYCWGSFIENNTLDVNFMEIGPYGYLYINCGFTGNTNLAINSDTAEMAAPGNYMIIYDTSGALINYYNAPKTFDIEFDYSNGVMYYTFYNTYPQDIDPGPLQNNIPAGHLVMIKCDLLGNYITAKSINLNYNLNTYCKNIIHNKDSNEIILYLDLRLQVDLDPNVLTPPVYAAPQGSNDIVIAVYDENFNYKNLFVLTGAGVELPGNMFNDDYNNLFLTGTYNVNIDLDPSVNTVLATANGTNYFICKLDSDFNYLWSKVYSAPDSLLQGGSVVDGFEGSIYTVGTFVGNVDMDAGTGITNVNSNGNYDIFLNKLDYNGDLIYAKSLGGIKYEKGQAITLDAERNVLLGGTYELTVDFDFNSTSNTLTGPLMDNIFFAKYSATPLEVKEWVNKFDQIQVYPNPSSNFIHISKPNFTNENAYITIYNSEGKIVLNKKQFLQNEIDIRNLPNGIYLIQLIIDGEYLIGKFVIEK